MQWISVNVQDVSKEITNKKSNERYHYMVSLKHVSEKHGIRL